NYLVVLEIPDPMPYVGQPLRVLQALFVLPQELPRCNLVGNVLDSSGKTNRRALTVRHRFQDRAHKPHFAVRTDNPVLHLNRTATGADLALELHHPFPVLGMDTVEERRPACRRVVRQPENPEDLFGPVARAVVEAPLPTPDPGQTMRVLEPQLAGPKRLHDLAALGNVRENRDPSVNAVVRTPGRHAHAMDPTRAGSGKIDPHFVFRALAGKDPLDMRPDRF